MKAVFIVILFITGATIQAANNNLEVLLGLRLGGGWATQKGNFDTGLSKLSGEDGTFLYKGRSIPIGIELLFEIKSFRIGYSFQYAINTFTNNTERYNYFSSYMQQSEIGVRNPKTTGNALLTNSLLIEYAFRIKPHFAIAPSANIGFFIGLGIPGVTYYDSQEHNYHSGLSTGASLNFEIKGKREKVTYVIAPTYKYYNGADFRAGKVKGHSASLEVVFRFRLNKKKAPVSTS